MHKINCLIVDDEPLAQEVLVAYIQALSDLEVVGCCHNAIEASLLLKKKKVDLLFLDIQMPRLTGIDFLKTLQHPPKVIFTTAYKEYALDGYDLDILDYLLKPIAFERFLTAVNKFQLLQPTSSTVFLQDTATLGTEAFIYLKADKKTQKVFLKNILYIESLKDYVKVKTIDQVIVTYQSISYLEEKLPDNQFIRIHRSYIVALDKITSFTAATIDIGKEELPIGRLYKNEVMKMLGVNS
jgi:DNA-binding LytR/AlgR family response regulator